MNAFWASSFVLLLSLLLVSLRFLLGGKGSNRVKHPCGPLRLPIIGHLHLLQAPLHRTLTRLCTRYGPSLLLCFGFRPVLVVSSPSAVEECFTTNDLTFGNRPLLLSGKHFHYNGTTFAIVPYGPEWRKLRSIATLQLFSSARLSMLAPSRAAEVCCLLRRLFLLSPRDDGAFLLVEVRPRLMELTFNTLMQMIMGKRHQGEPETGGAEVGERFSRIKEEIFRLSTVASPEDFLPFLKWVGVSGIKRRMRSLGKEIDDLMQEMVDNRRRERKEEEDDANKAFVDVMLAMQEEDPQYFTDIIIKGMIQVNFLAGTDTSTMTMEWAMSLLLNHPEVLMKAHEEIEIHVGHQRLVADSDIPNLRYLNNIIKETLRLFPPGPLLVPRESTTECKVDGVDVPRGTMLLVNAYKMHRDPELWTHPLEFMPERFETEEEKWYKYVPFGAGRRQCPGKALALRTIGLVLACLIQCFEWKSVGEEVVDLTEGDGLTAPKATPLQAMCRPRQAMIHVLSQL